MSYNVTVDGVNFNVQITELASSEITAKVALADAAVALAQTAQADAEGARDTALTYRDTTLTYKDQAEGHATTAAAEAANALSAVTWQDLAGLTFAFSETIVDATVYDTTQDYDGGAWRFNKRASWYQEDRTTGTYLGEFTSTAAAYTAGGAGGDYYYNTGVYGFYELDGVGASNVTTRAGSAEFPAVAYITAEAARVVIWDAQTGGMWMAFEVNTSRPLFGDSVSAIAVLNGFLQVVSNGTYGAYAAVSFPTDDFRLHTADVYFIPKNISQRGQSAGIIIQPSLPVIVNRIVNDVAITTLPNAPIDPATGLPKPTIAVATDGGVSVITDDEIGTVVDNTSILFASGEVSFIAFTQDNRIACSSREKSYVRIIDIPTIDTSTVAATDLAFFRSDSAPASSGRDVALPVSFLSFTAAISIGEDRVAISHSDGLSIVAPSSFSADDTCDVVFMTSDYSTGWMPGDIKGAWLASTDDTDLVGGELVTNGTFDTDTTGWTGRNGNSILAVSSNRLSVSAGAADTAYAYQQITATAGVTYVLTVDYFDITGAPRVHAGVGPGSNAYADSGNLSGDGSLTLTFTPTSDNPYITFYAENSSTIGVESQYDNISVKLADADRSVNANGLAVNGTVQKTAVATGAELVGYGGLTAANHLFQPYNADLDFGTGDFYFMCWVKTTDAYFTFMDCGIASNVGFFFGATSVPSPAALQAKVGASALLTSAPVPSLISDTWQYVTICRSGDNVKFYVNGNFVSSSSGIAIQSATDSNQDGTRIGVRQDNAQTFSPGRFSLMRIGAGEPTPEQIRKIYNDEEWMFQPGAQVTLNGSSDAVTALAHDKVTDLLHVGTSGGMSVFDGLVRVSEDATAVTTSISANNGRIVRQ